MVDDLLDVGAELDHVVAGVADEVARDGYRALNKGHALLDRVGNGLGGRGVAHDAADVCRQLAAGNLTAHDLLDEHLFSTLGVLRLSGDHTDVIVGRDLLFHKRHGVGLVVLDEDHALGRGNGLHHGAQAEDDVVGVLKHDAVVRR